MVRRSQFFSVPQSCRCFVGVEQGLAGVSLIESPQSFTFHASIPMKVTLDFEFSNAEYLRPSRHFLFVFSVSNTFAKGFKSSLCISSCWCDQGRFNMRVIDKHTFHMFVGYLSRKSVSRGVKNLPSRCRHELAFNKRKIVRYSRVVLPCWNRTGH